MDSPTSTAAASTSKTPKIRGRKRASTSAPKKTSLLPPPAKRLLDDCSPTTVTQNNVISFGYTPFENNYNGYTCRFLRREYQFILKFFSQQLLFTKNESLAVFTLDEYFRDFCETQIAALLNPWAHSNVTLVNPFSVGESKSFKPIFIRLSAACSYYFKKDDQAAVQCSHFERHEQGSCFAGRVAISIKGIKYSPDGKQVSPIIHVCQVLEHDFAQKTTATDLARTTCLVDDAAAMPAAPDATTTTMNDDTQSLGSDNERVLLAYLEAESRRLDEQCDSAIESTSSN